MKFEEEINIDVEKLKEDLIEYFSTAINPFDADLMNVENIKFYSYDKIIELAKNNGFNIEYYKI